MTNEEFEKSGITVTQFLRERKDYKMNMNDVKTMQEKKAIAEAIAFDNKEQSTNFELKTRDYSKIRKGAAIAFAGAMIPFLSDFFNMIDWGGYDAIAGAVAATLINAIRKWVVNNKVIA